MNYEETKKWLNRAYMIEPIIRSDKSKIKELESLSTSIGGLDYSKPNIQTSKDNEAVFVKRSNELIDIKKDYQGRVLKQENIKNEIRDKIDYLTDNSEKIILIYRHIDFYDWSMISDLVCYSKRQVFRIYNNAINNLSDVL